MRFLWIIGMDFTGGYVIIHIVTPQKKKQHLSYAVSSREGILLWGIAKKWGLLYTDAVSFFDFYTQPHAEEI